ERRRLSLSIKRVEGQVLPVRPILPPTEADLEDMPELGLSEDVFATEAPEASEAAPAADGTGLVESEAADGSEATRVPSAADASPEPPAADAEPEPEAAAEVAAEPEPE